MAIKEIETIKAGLTYRGISLETVIPWETLTKQVQCHGVSGPRADYGYSQVNQMPERCIVQSANLK